MLMIKFPVYLTTEEIDILYKVHHKEKHYCMSDFIRTAIFAFCRSYGLISSTTDFAVVDVPDDFFDKLGKDDNAYSYEI